MSTLPAVVEAPPASLPSPSRGLQAIASTINELKAIRTFIKEEFVPGVDYGRVPGTDKDTLMQPGAQKAAMYFNAYPRHTIERVELGDGHLEVMVTSHLVNRASGNVIAEGVGSCSTMEKKYRYRNADRLCPECGQPQIRKSKQEEGKPRRDAWYCWKKMGGCGATFPEGDKRIEGQTVGQVPNPDIHDVRNTVLKMAKKRADVDAAMSLGCLSELFTQDLDDTYDITQVAPDQVVDVPFDPVPPKASSDREAARREINESFPRPNAPKPQGRGQAAPTADNQTGHGSGKYADPRDIAAYNAWVRDFTAKRNADWVESWTRECGHFPTDVKSDPISEFAVVGHLVKWGLRTGKLADVGIAYDPDTGKPTEAVKGNQGRRFGGILWARHCEELLEEALDWADKIEADLWNAWPGWSQSDEGPDPEIDVDSSEREPGSDG